MEKEQLLATCRQLIHDMEQELKDNDIGEAIEDLYGIFTNLKTLENEIDILSPHEEEKLDEIITILGEIDLDKLRSVGEMVNIVDTIQELLGKFKSKILLGKTEEMMELLQNIRSLLETLVKRI